MCIESLNNTINNTPQHRHDAAPSANISISISATVWWGYVVDTNLLHLPLFLHGHMGQRTDFATIGVFNMETV